MAKALPLVGRQDLAGQVEALVDDGFAYFPKFISSQEVAELRAAMDRLQTVAENLDYHYTPKSDGYLNKHVKCAFNRDPIFLPYLDKPGLIELAEAIHGDDCHIVGMSAWVTGPGRPAQRLHVDWLPISLPEDILADPRVKMPVFITTAHFYLNDIYEELGPTQFVPGSHRSGRSPAGVENPPPNGVSRPQKPIMIDGETEWHGIEPQSILCEAGDVVIFRSEVWHRGTANKSQETRYLLQVHYSNRMITQKFPPYPHAFQFDQQIFSRATPRQRRLLGEHQRANYD